jgi:hypothetical protein
VVLDNGYTAQTPSLRTGGPLPPHLSVGYKGTVSQITHGPSQVPTNTGEQWGPAKLLLRLLYSPCKIRLISSLTASFRSILVNEFRSSCKNKVQDRERLAYFYFDRTNRPKELYPTSWILRAIVKQLTAPESTGTVMEKVWQKREEKMASGFLNEKECTDLIIQLINCFSLTFIVIDGVDEYVGAQPSDQTPPLFKRLKEILHETTAIVKIFLSSLPSPFLESQLKDFTDLHTIPMSYENQADIQSFVEKRVHDSVADEFLLGNFIGPGMTSLKDKLICQIIEKLTNEAEGMSVLL